MPYCLNRDELTKFLMFRAKQGKFEEDDQLLILMIENAENWYDEISILTYLLSKVIERLAKQQIPCKPILDATYELSDKMWVYLQEFDADFIDYMLRHLRSDDSLEENLVELQNQFGERKYGTSFCD